MKCSVPRNHLEGDQEGLARHITCNAACKHTCPSACAGHWRLLEACYDKQEMAQKVTMGDIRDALAFFSDRSASAETGEQRTVRAQADILDVPRAALEAFKGCIDTWVTFHFQQARIPAIAHVS